MICSVMNGILIDDNRNGGVVGRVGFLQLTSITDYSFSPLCSSVTHNTVLYSNICLFLDGLDSLMCICISSFVVEGPISEPNIMSSDSQRYHHIPIHNHLVLLLQNKIHITFVAYHNQVHPTLLIFNHGIVKGLSAVSIKEL